MPPLLIGFLSGVLLVALRAPLGIELFQFPATTAGLAAGFRAAALAAIGLGLVAAAPGLGARPAVGRLVLGAALGLGYRGLLWERDATAIGGLAGAIVLVALLGGRGGGREALSRRLRAGLVGAALALALVLASEPQRPGTALACGLLGLGAIVLVGRWQLFVGPAGTPREPAPDDASPSEGPTFGELSGLALAGAGAALALEGVARHLRLLGGGLAQDDSLMGTLFLVLVAVGAAAFADSLRGRTTRAVAAGLGLAGTALACFASLRALGRLASPRGLDAYLRTVDGWLPWDTVDISRHGMLAYDLAVALPILALPAVLLGAALRACRGATLLGAVLIGGAAGLVAAPALMGFELGTDGFGRPVLSQSSSSAGLIAIGAKLAPLGALLAIALGHGLASLGLRAGAAAGILLAIGGFVLSATPVQVLSPWDVRQPVPRLVLDTPEGLLAIEGLRGGISSVTLDRRPLSPGVDHAPEDRAQFEAAWSLLPLTQRTRQEARVLLIGQLTPGRALTLTDLGAARIDRTGSWSAAMPLLEAELFGGTPPPPGEILPLPEARARLAAGAYDLVIVPPVPGEAPSTRNLGWPVAAGGEAPRATRVVVWLDTRTDFAHLDLGATVLVATAELRELGLALVYGGGAGEAGAPRPEGVDFLGAGEPLHRSDALDRLRMRPDERLRDNRRRVSRRLAGGNPEGAAAPLTQALAHYFADQRRSSAFEPPANRIALGDRSLELFGAAGLAAEERTLLLNNALEALTAVLRGKRWVEEIELYLAPVAERHYPWPVLEQALAYVDLELLEPELAAERMLRLLGQVRGTSEDWALLGEAQAQSDQTREAVDSFRAAVERAPGSRALRRRLAIQLVLASDAQGEALLRELLLEDSGDEELERWLGAGPHPELPRGYRPPVGAHGHDHGHGDHGGTDADHDDDDHDDH